jgi:hypothetical protein
MSSPDNADRRVTKMGRHEAQIRDWCSRNAVSIPAGFGRNTPGYLALVKEASDGRSLVATTWGKLADVTYYIENLLLKADPESRFEVLDFKKKIVLGYLKCGKFSQLRVLDLDGTEIGSQFVQAS